MLEAFSQLINIKPIEPMDFRDDVRRTPCQSNPCLVNELPQACMTGTIDFAEITLFTIKPKKHMTMWLAFLRTDLPSCTMNNFPYSTNTQRS